MVATVGVGAVAGEGADVGGCGHLCGFQEELNLVDLLSNVINPPEIL